MDQQPLIDILKNIAFYMICFACFLFMIFVVDAVYFMHSGYDFLGLI